jgi:predicted membrane chloride channel (bestrophin family)
MLMREIKGHWFNATSSLVAFCNTNGDKAAEVEIFHHQLIRLVSLLFCASLIQIADMKDERFEVIEFGCFPLSDVNFLETSYNKSEIIIHWIQRLILDNVRGDVISVPPPILNRVLSDFTTGSIKVDRARGLTDVPFPFPYAQMVTLLLCLFSVIMPTVIGMTVETNIWAFVSAFVSVVVMVGVNYIAVEVERPFGDDVNDLELKAFQVEVNRSLITLLSPSVQVPPVFTFTESTRDLALVAWDGEVRKSKSTKNRTDKRTANFDKSLAAPKITWNTSHVPQHRQKTRACQAMATIATAGEASITLAGPGMQTSPTGGKWCAAMYTDGQQYSPRFDTNEPTSGAEEQSLMAAHVQATTLDTPPAFSAPAFVPRTPPIFSASAAAAGYTGSPPGALQRQGMQPTALGGLRKEPRFQNEHGPGHTDTFGKIVMPNPRE